VEISLNPSLEIKKPINPSLLRYINPNMQNKVMVSVNKNMIMQKNLPATLSKLIPNWNMRNEMDRNSMAPIMGPYFFCGRNLNVLTGSLFVITVTVK